MFSIYFKAISKKRAGISAKIISFYKFSPNSGKENILFKRKDITCRLYKTDAKLHVRPDIGLQLPSTAGYREFPFLNPFH
jgi:hypothetical protein